jgi:hypothetical protein
LGQLDGELRLVLEVLDLIGDSAAIVKPGSGFFDLTLNSSRLNFYG